MSEKNQKVVAICRLHLSMDVMTFLPQGILASWYSLGDAVRIRNAEVTRRFHGKYIACILDDVESITTIRINAQFSAPCAYRHHRGQPSMAVSFLGFLPFLICDLSDRPSSSRWWHIKIRWIILFSELKKTWHHRYALQQESLDLF